MDNEDEKRMTLSIEQQNLLDRIGKVWRSMPSLRFLQLIGNCFGPVTNLGIFVRGQDPG